jgi:cell division protein FtsI (penicillin-binding protein 3)
MRHSPASSFFRPWRFKVLVLILLIFVIALVLRMIYLTIIDRHFLLAQGNVRVLRMQSIPAYRGMIVDRNNNPLAMSIPVDSIWINPQDFSLTPESIFQLANILTINPKELTKLIKNNKNKQFVYIKRDVDISVAQQVQALGLSGIYAEHEYRRYYSQAEATSQILGFTNVDDKGEEGLELAYDPQLQGIPGQEQVLKDRYGNTVAVLGVKKEAKPGNNLTLSIDQRLQYLAYQTLKDTVNEFDAESGSVIILNPKNGEVLAMANVPSYDPNQHTNKVEQNARRNRAVTDMYEPGSTMKTFTIINGLKSGKFTPNSIIETGNGTWHIGHHPVTDDTVNGTITVTQVLQKSSNIGAAKIILNSTPTDFIETLHSLGFGQKTASGFPGESPGELASLHRRWDDFSFATRAFGYGETATPLQLAHAYAIVANRGVDCPISVLKLDNLPVCHSVLSPHIADQMITMLETVLDPATGGNGGNARVPNYHVAGKTGTAYIATAHGYDHTAYTSSFIGMAPATNPQLVVAVILRRPHGHHMGATVSAPAFATIMEGALRILNISPDDYKK